VKRIGRASTLAAGAFLAATLAYGQTQPTAEAHATARKLVDLMTAPLKSGQMADMLVQAQVQANPNLKPYDEVMHRWVKSIFEGDEYDTAMVTLYEEAFSPDELKALLAFYSTPTGQKAIAAMPEVMQKGMMIGVNLAQKHVAELTAMIKERDEELKAAKTAADDAAAPAVAHTDDAKPAAEPSSGTPPPAR
jgi:hypothetical protein